MEQACATKCPGCLNISLSEQSRLAIQLNGQRATRSGNQLETLARSHSLLPSDKKLAKGSMFEKEKPPLTGSRRQRGLRYYLRFLLIVQNLTPGPKVYLREGSRLCRQTLLHLHDPQIRAVAAKLPSKVPAELRNAYPEISISVLSTSHVESLTRGHS